MKLANGISLTDKLAALRVVDRQEQEDRRLAALDGVDDARTLSPKEYQKLKASLGLVHSRVPPRR